MPKNAHSRKYKKKKHNKRGKARKTEKNQAIKTNNVNHTKPIMYDY